MPPPTGRLAIAANRRSPIRSSVISQRRGRGWRGAMALPIAAAMSEASQRLEDVCAGIGRAAKLAGRRAEDVTLIAVSKTQPPEAIELLILAGQRDFGENRVQEAETKWPALRESFPDLRLHF